MGLRDAIENASLKREKLDPKKFVFRVVNLEQLMKLVEGKTIVAVAEWSGPIESGTMETESGSRDYQWSIYAGHGCPFVEEAFVLSDGTIVATISCTAFTDTFHSIFSRTYLFHATEGGTK